MFHLLLGTENDQELRHPVQIMQNWQSAQHLEFRFIWIQFKSFYIRLLATDAENIQLLLARIGNLLY